MLLQGIFTRFKSDAQNFDFKAQGNMEYGI